MNYNYYKNGEELKSENLKEKMLRLIEEGKTVASDSKITTKYLNILAAVIRIENLEDFPGRYDSLKDGDKDDLISKALDEYLEVDTFDLMEEYIEAHDYTKEDLKEVLPEKSVDIDEYSGKTIKAIWADLKVKRELEENLDMQF